MQDSLSFEDRDEFNRKPFAEFLINLIQDNNELFPLAITGNWGTGKTEFCKKTIFLINQNHHERLIAGDINAFAEDCYNDPLVSILASLYKTFIPEERKSESLIAITKLLSAHIGLSFLKITVPALGALADAVEKTIPHLNNDTIQESFKNRSQIHSYIKELKEVINKIAQDKTFVLFIDELDRCRPDFALQTLETVKHIFNIPNLKIIFVINKEQLTETIKHFYGDNSDAAEEYLDKFFQIQLKLPELSSSQNNEQEFNSIKYLDIEFERTGVFNLPLFNDGLYSKAQGSTSMPAHLLRELSQAYHLSLRDIEKLAKYICIYNKTKKLSQKRNLAAFPLIEAYAIFHFTFNKKSYQNFKNNRPPLENCNDLFVSPAGSKIPIRLILYRILNDEKAPEFTEYFGYFTLEERRKFLHKTFFNLHNLLLQ